MKRKTIILPLLLLFLFTNSGMVANVHWCGGKIASIDFFETEAKCFCGKKTMKAGCCKDKTVILKSTPELAKDVQLFFNLDTSKVLNTLFVPQMIEVLTGLKPAITDFYHPPPFNTTVPIFILVSTFRI